MSRLKKKNPPEMIKMEHTSSNKSETVASWLNGPKV